MDRFAIVTGDITASDAERLISLPVGTVFHNFLPDINGMLSPQAHWRGEYRTRHLWKRRAVGSVSYTHLDVYKRQV